MRKLTYFYSLLLAALFLLPWSAKATQLNEGFEGDLFIPEGWNSIHVSGSEEWIRIRNNDSYVGYNSPSCTQIKYASNGHENYLITPQLEPKSGESLTFYVKRQYSGTDLRVEISTTTAKKTAFSLLETISNADITTSWEQKTIDLSAYVGQPIYIAFHVIDNNGSTLFFDDVAGVSIYEPTCFTPTLTLDSKTETSATFSWTKGGTESQWQYLCLPATTSLTNEYWNSATSINEQTVTISGLDALTSYVFYLRADCGGDDYSMYVSKDFATECGSDPVSIPTGGWTYGFEDTSIPDCFKTLRTNANFDMPDINTSAPHSGDRSAHFNGSGSSAKVILVLPMFEVDIKYLKLSFYYQNGSTYSSRPGFQVGYITDPTNISTYSALTSGVITRKTSYDASPAPYVLDDFSAAPSGAYIAICYTGGYYEAHSYLDDIKVESKQDCSAPTVSSVEQLSLTSAHVTWGAKDGVPTYQYCVVAKDAEADWSGNLTVNTNTVDITSGISAGNEYDFYVKCVCGGDPSDAYTFSLASCPTVTEVTLDSKVYNGVTVNWATSFSDKYDVRYKASDDADWTSAGTNLEGTSKAITGLVVGKTYSFQVKPNCGDDETWVAAGETYTPEYPKPAVVTASPVRDVTATIAWSSVTGATGYQYSCVPAGNEPSWSETVTGTSANLSGLAVTANYTASVRAVFPESGYSEATTNNFTTVCQAPTSILKGATTSSSLTFSWSKSSETSADNQYQYICKEGSTPPTDEQWTANGILLPVDVRTATVEGLKSNTTYYFFVRSYYASVDKYSADIQSYNTTDCGTENVGWSESFGSALPSCWSTYYTYWSSSSYQWKPSMDYTKRGSYSMQVYSYQYSSSNIANLETPSIAITEKANLSFYYMCSNAVPFSVIMKVNGKETELASYNAAKSSFGDSTIVAIPDTCVGKTISIIFRATGAGTSVKRKLYIDEVRVNYQPIDAPTNLAAVAGDASATISWEHAENGPFELRYRAYKAEEPYNNWTDVTNINAKEKLIEGLTNGTKYEVQVRAAVSEHRISEWTDLVEVTPVLCPTVTDASLSNKLHNSVTVNCALSATGSWNLEKKVDDDEWTSVATEIADATKEVTVEVGHSYKFRVKSSCGTAWTEIAESYAPAFPVPAPSVSAKTDATATIAWAAVTDATGYKCLYVLKDAAAPSDDSWAAAETLTEPSASLTNLVGGTDYDVYVLAVFATGESDPVKVDLQTTTVAPTALTQGTTTTDKIAFSWSYDGAATQFQWKSSKEGSDWSTPITVTNAEETGLSAGTTYTFYVRAYYAEGKYSDELTGSFGTECPTESLPQTFSGWTAIPNCWYTLRTSDEAYDLPSVYNGELKFRGNNSDMKTTRKSVLVLPKFTKDIQKLQIVVEYQNGGSSATTPQFIVGYVTDPEDVTTFNTIAELDRYYSWSAYATSEEIGLSGAATNAHIAIAYGNPHSTASSASATTGYIKSITVSELPACRKPTDLGATTTYNSATLSWTPGNTETAWVMEYSTSNTDWTGANTVDVSTTPSTTISNLVTGTPLYARVKAVCGGEDGESEYSNVASFTPNYVAPSGLTVSNISTNSARITWTANSGESAWTLQYKKSTESVWNDVPVTTNPYDLALPEAGTNYDVRVLAGTLSSNTESFQTECENISTLPWKEDFEDFNSEAIPTCWDNSGSTASGSTYHKWGVFVNSGNKMIRMNNYNAGQTNGTAIINSPSIELPASPAYELAFEYTHSSTAGEMTVKIYDGENWTNLQSFAKNSDNLYYNPGELTEAKISLADYAGKTIKLQFYSLANYGNGAIFVDNVEVRIPIACPTPKNVLVSNVTATSASVAWTEKGTATAWAIQTSTDGTNWGTEIAVDTNPFVVNNLEASTTYYARVKAVCGGEDGESEWSDASDAFTTDCNPLDKVLIEDFDDQNTLPSCWKVTELGTNGNQWAVYTEGGNSGSNSMRYNAKTAYANSADLISAPITLPTNAVLSFYYTKSSYISAEVYIDNGTVTSLMSIPSKSDWTKATVDLSSYSGQTVKFIFRGHGYSTSYTQWFYVDDVRVIRTETLADNDENNDTKLAGMLNQTADVTLGRTFKKATYFNTLCLPFDLPTLDETPLEGGELWAFKYINVDGDSLYIRIIEASGIEAGVPYLICWPNATDVTDIANPLFKNVTIGAAEGKNVGESNLQFRGILQPEPFYPGDRTKLFVAANNTLYWWAGTSDSQLNGFRAYFHVATGGDSPFHGMPARLIKYVETPTDVEQVQGAENISVKVLENNQVVIIRNGVKYTIQGQKLQ